MDKSKEEQDVFSIISLGSVTELTLGGWGEAFENFGCRWPRRFDYPSPPRPPHLKFLS